MLTNPMKPQKLEISDSESSENEETVSKLDQAILVAAKANRLEDVEKCLQEGADVHCAGEDGWTPLMWSASNGNEEVARVLIHHGALVPYTRGGILGHQATEEETFVKPMDYHKAGKQSPLLWAAYKGHYSLVQLFINLGCSPLETDIHGNSAIHQAAAGGHIAILELLVNKGIDFAITNARGHTALELATDPATIAFIMKALNTNKCTSCTSDFNFKNLRFFCSSSKKFFCKDCSVVTMEYHNW